MSWRCSAESNDGLVNNLLSNAIVKVPRVGEAMKKVDRGNFIEQDPYQDAPQQIGYKATISAPHMHAYVLEMLAEQAQKPGAHILDVGSGSGYLCAAFAELAPSDARIYGIDYLPELTKLSEKNLNKQVESISAVVSLHMLSYSV
jgi:protein-L-isoaspartate(D-aspartate) O-methyltransferase